MIGPAPRFDGGAKNGGAGFDRKRRKKRGSADLVQGQVVERQLGRGQVLPQVLSRATYPGSGARLGTAAGARPGPLGPG